MLDAQASIVVIPVVGRIEMIGLSVDDGAEIAGISRRRKESDEYHNDAKAYAI